MKIVGGDTFYSYYILYQYFKIQKFAKNSKILRPSKKHKPYFLYPTEEPCIISKRLNEYHRRRCILYLLYIKSLFQKFQKNRQKLKNYLIVKKSTGRVANLVVNICVKFESYPIKTVGGDRF